MDTTTLRPCFWSIMKPYYNTARLSVFEVSQELKQPDFFIQIIELLTPNVVVNLPPHFSSVSSISSAQTWLETMQQESHLFAIYSLNTKQIMGFLFASKQSNTTAHIGYLLGEAYWHKGFASELLDGFVKRCSKDAVWDTLVAGVASHNIASSKVLLKTGFIKQKSPEQSMLYYEYKLPYTLTS